MLDAKTGERKPKVLGAWDTKTIKGGALYVKPGMLVPLDTGEGKELRARGIGRKELEKSRAVLLDAWETWDRVDYSEAARVPVIARRFYGAKVAVASFYRCRACDGRWPGVVQQGCQTPTCERYGEPGTDERTILRRAPPCSAECRAKLRRAVLENRTPKGCGRVVKRRIANPATSEVETVRMRCLAPLYGTWGPHEMLIAFDPYPKRERDVNDGAPFARLHVRDLGGVASLPYAPGKTTPEGDAAREARELAEWQHDADGGEVKLAAE